MPGIDLHDDGKWNRYLLILAALFAVAGLANNLVRSFITGMPSELLSWLLLVTMAVWVLATAFAVGFGLVRGHRTFETWGFVVNRRLWISAVLVVAVGLIVMPQVSGLVWFIGLTESIQTVTAALEELFFRGILISALLAVVRPKSKLGVFGLIVVSATLFSVVHIPTKAAPELTGIFISAVALGYIYYFTGSLLFPIFVHVLANTAEKAGPIGAVLAVALYFIVAGVVWLWSRSKTRVEAPAT